MRVGFEFRNRRWIALLALGPLVSCAATEKQVEIWSNPTGATVYLNGEHAGTTKLSTELSFEELDSYSVTLKKEGYEDAEFEIAYRPSEQTSYSAKLQKRETVTVPLVSVEPARTDRGEVELTITRTPTTAYLETIERSPNVGTVAQVTYNQDVDVQVGSPVFSPTANVLIFTEITQQDGESLGSNVFRQEPGSPAKTRITFGEYFDLSPCFTPDGASVLFSSNRTSSNPTLWRVLLSGEGGLMKITDSQALDFSPSVSKDGAKIAFASLPLAAEDRQIWTIEASGSYPTQLREGDQPRISPDGKRILFVRKDDRTGKNQIWIMSVAGGEETLLSSNTDYDVIDPSWSPDGSWIVFASDEALDSKKTRNFDIWSMRPDGSGKTQLTTNGSRDDSPCWDHDGAFIYFRSNRGGVWNIWRFRPSL